MKKIVLRPWFISLVSHVFLVIILAFLGLPTVDATSSISLAFQEERLEEEVSVIEIEQVEFTEEIGSVDTQVDVPIERMELEVKTPDYIPENEKVSFLLDDTADYAIRLEPSSRTSSPVETEHPGMALASGTGTGQGSGGDGDGRGRSSSFANNPQEETTFFGVGVYGRRIVFMLDYSGSMNDRVGHERTVRAAEADRRNLKGRERYEFISKPDKFDFRLPTRMEVVVSELKKVITALPQETEFSIVCFSKVLHELDGGMQKATLPNKRTAIAWLDEHTRGYDNENPLLGLQRAYKINPDTIYFVGDGEFDSNIVRQATRMNHSVVIHTLGFSSPKGFVNLVNLAAYNGGRFKKIR